EDELGEWLLAVVRSARDSGMDAERALRAAVRRYQDAERGQSG
ncbi:MAG: nucleotide pyrophosphohydrolase, partial [Actinomycetes bacterium]